VWKTGNKQLSDQRPGGISVPLRTLKGPLALQTNKRGFLFLILQLGLKKIRAKSTAKNPSHGNIKFYQKT